MEQLQPYLQQLLVWWGLTHVKLIVAILCFGFGLATLMGEESGTVKGAILIVVGLGIILNLVGIIVPEWGVSKNNVREEQAAPAILKPRGTIVISGDGRKH